MKILKPGKNNEITKECSRCGCIFQYNPYVDVDIIVCGVEQSAFVKCPSCRDVSLVPTFHESHKTNNSTTEGDN